MAVLDRNITDKISPDKKTVFRLNPDKPTSEVKLKSTEWQIILQIDGKKNIQDIIDQLGVDEQEILTHITNLYEKNVIIPEIMNEPSHDVFVDTEFFTKFENVLINYIGPVASYVINDVLLELNEEQDKFLKDNVPLLIESVSQEILDEAKRVKFQQEMLKVIKKL